MTDLELQASAEATYAALRGDASLSSRARTALMALEYTSLTDYLSTAAASDSTQRAQDLAAAQRDLYGIDDLTAGTTAAERAGIDLSYRDAQDRAARLDSDDEALAMLDRALASGDELLARAVGGQSLQDPRMWQTQQRYLTARPDVRQKAESVQSLEQPMPLMDGLQYIAIKPMELDGLSPMQLQQLADEARNYPRSR